MCWPSAGASTTTPSGHTPRWATEYPRRQHGRSKLPVGMEKWKAKSASHFPTPTTTATGHIYHPLRYTNNLTGTKDRAGRDLWTVIGAKMPGHALHHHHVCQRTDHLGAWPTSLASNHQTLPGVLIDQVQHPYRAAVVRLGADEVITPHMVLVLRSQPHTRSIVEPQAVPCFLFLWNLQPFATPDSLDSILANLPFRSLQ